MVAKRSVFSQLQQRHHVPRAGPHFAFSPTSYGVTITDAAGDLRPRKAGLFLEPRQALWEVAGENVGPSAVLCALSRHRAGPSKACVGALSLRERPGRAATARRGRFRRRLVRSQGMGEARSGRGQPPLRTSMCAGFLRWPGPPTPPMEPLRAGGPARPSRLRLRLFRGYIEPVGLLALPVGIHRRHPVAVLHAFLHVAIGVGHGLAGRVDGGVL